MNLVLYQKAWFSSEGRSDRDQDTDPISTGNGSVTDENTYDSEINVV